LWAESDFCARSPRSSRTCCRRICFFQFNLELDGAGNRPSNLNSLILHVEPVGYLLGDSLYKAEHLLSARS
jgi:hypothetical protein